MTPDRQDAETAVAVERWKREHGMGEYAWEVMEAAEAAKRQAREAIKARQERYQAAVERAAAGNAPTAEEATILGTAPLPADWESLQALDARIEDQVAKRITEEAIAARDKKKAEIQGQIDQLESQNAKGREDLAKVDQTHARAVNEARQAIAAWHGERGPILADIRRREQEAKQLATKKAQVAYVDHVTQLAMRRSMEAERRSQSAVRREASACKTEAETYGPTDRELPAVLSAAR